MTDDNAAPASVAVTHRYKYDAFGVGLEASRASGEFVNAYRYTGEQYDGARYCPTTGATAILSPRKRQSHKQNRSIRTFLFSGDSNMTALRGVHSIG
jgi:hypothetical protein